MTSLTCHLLTGKFSQRVEGRCEMKAVEIFLNFLESRSFGCILRLLKFYNWGDGDKLHTEKSFRNLITSIRNQIVFSISRLIWNQPDVRLVPNQSENGKYNLISGWFKKISLFVTKYREEGFRFVIKLTYSAGYQQ